MQTKIAKNLMIPIEKYPQISQSSTLKDAVRMFQQASLDINGQKSLARALLVFDASNNLVGTVRRRDILNALDPENLFGIQSEYSRKLFDVKIDPNLIEIFTDSISNTINKKANLPIKEFMMPILHTVDSEDHLLKIIYEIDLNRSSMIPVSKDGVVVGVVRTVEVLKELAQILEVA